MCSLEARRGAGRGGGILAEDLYMQRFFKEVMCT